VAFDSSADIESVPWFEKAGKAHAFSLLVHVQRNVDN
jgi:hypothetical protein